VTPNSSHCVSQSQGQPCPFLRYCQQWGQFQTFQKVHSDNERNTGARIWWTLGSCATLPVCQIHHHPTKHFHHSRPVGGVECGKSSSTVPMEYTIKCQYTYDHYVNGRDTQTDRHCHYHWTSHTWIDLIGLRVDTFTEIWSQQGTNQTRGGSSLLWEITKISAIHCRLVLERKTVFRYHDVFSLEDQSQPRLPWSTACPYRAGWKQHLHQDKNKSNIPAQKHCTQTKIARGVHTRTFHWWFSVWWMSACSPEHSLDHPSARSWRSPPRWLFSKSTFWSCRSSAGAANIWYTHVCRLVKHSVFVQNLPKQLRIFQALDKGPDTLGNFHRRTPPTSSSCCFDRCIHSVLLCTELLSTTRWTAGRLLYMVAVLTCSLIFNHVKWQHANRRTRELLSTVGCWTLVSHFGFWIMLDRRQNESVVQQ